MPIKGERLALRRRHRSARRHLSASQQRLHAQAVRRCFLASPLAWRSRRIAAYLSVDGELNLRALLDDLQRMGKLLALPVVEKSPQLGEREGLAPRKDGPQLGEREGLAPRKDGPQPGEREGSVPRRSGNRMSFFVHRPEAPLTRNRFGIEEPPLGAPWINTRALDLVLAPLVAFDDQGNRLGMGGGFYDRHFGNLPKCLRPLLVGVAHEVQRADALPAAPWDVPLDGILTETGWRRFSPRMGF